MRYFILLLLLNFSLATAQELKGGEKLIPQTDSCDFDVPFTIYLDCQFGKDFWFEVKCDCELSDYSLNIYDRWGEQVFSTTDIEKIWNATLFGYHGELTDTPRKNLADGTYFWVIEAVYSDGAKKTKKGTVSVLR